MVNLNEPHRREPCSDKSSYAFQVRLRKVAMEKVLPLSEQDFQEVCSRVLRCQVGKQPFGEYG